MVPLGVLKEHLLDSWPPMGSSSPQLRSEKTQQLDIPCLSRRADMRQLPDAVDGTDLCVCIGSISLVMICSKPKMSHSEVPQELHSSLLDQDICQKLTFDPITVKQSAAKNTRVMESRYIAWISTGVEERRRFSSLLHSFQRVFGVWISEKF